MWCNYSQGSQVLVCTDRHILLPAVLSTISATMLTKSLRIISTKNVQEVTKTPQTPRGNIFVAKGDNPWIMHEESI